MARPTLSNWIRISRAEIQGIQMIPKFTQMESHCSRLKFSNWSPWDPFRGSTKSNVKTFPKFLYNYWRELSPFDIYILVKLDWIQSIMILIFILLNTVLLKQDILCQRIEELTMKQQMFQYFPLYSEVWSKKSLFSSSFFYAYRSNLVEKFQKHHLNIKKKITFLTLNTKCLKLTKSKRNGMEGEVIIPLALQGVSWVCVLARSNI